MTAASAHPRWLVEVLPVGEGVPRRTDLVFEHELAGRDGATQVDSSGGGVDSSSVTVECRAPGRDVAASAVYGDGISGHQISLGAITLADGAMTLAATLWAESSASGSVALWTLDSGGSLRAQVRITTGGAIELRLSNGTTTVTATSSATIAKDRWWSIAVVCTPSGGNTLVDFYADGSALGTQQSIAQLLTTPTSGYAHRLLGGPGGTAENWCGPVDEVRLWAVSLTANEVAQLHRATTSPRWRAVSGGASVDGYTASIAAVRPFASRYDLANNAPEFGELEIEVIDDGWWAELARDYMLRGATVRLSLGDSRMLGTSEYELEFVGKVVDWIPVHGGPITVRVVREAFDWLEADVSGSLYYGHPLEVSLALLRAAGAERGLSSAYVDSLIDVDSWDWSADTDRSHWWVALGRSRQEDQRMLLSTVDDSSPPLLQYVAEIPIGTTARELLLDLWKILPGRVLFSAAGVVSWSWYDETGAVDHLLTDDDLLESPVVETNTGNLANELEVRISPPGSKSGAQSGAYAVGPNTAPIDPDAGDYYHSQRTWGSGERAPADAFLVRLRAADSIARAGKPGTSIESRWLGGIHQLWGTAGAGRYAVVNVPGGRAGVSGFGLDVADRTAIGTQAADRQLSAARPLYIVTPGNTIARVETPPYQAWGHGGHEVDAAGYHWPVAVTDEVDPANSRVYYDVAAWGEFGTGSTQFNIFYGWVADCTIAVDYGQIFLRRFADGCPILRAVVSLLHRDIRIGDFVSLSVTRFSLARLGGSSELTGDSVFEVVGRELDAQAGRVTLTLAWVRDDFAIPVDVTAEASSPLGDRQVLHTAYPSLPFFDPVPTASDAGLGFTLSAGVLRWGSSRWDTPETTWTLQASKRTWIYWNTAARTYVLYPDTLGSVTFPAAPWWHRPVWYADTDGSSVTAEAAIAIKATGGSAAVVSGSSISGLSITAAQIGDGEIDEDKLATSVAGSGLAGGGGAALSVNVDGSTIEINTDTLRVKAAGIGTSHVADDAIDDDKTIRTARASVQTTDGTTTTIATISLADNSAVLVDALVVARQTSGAAHAGIVQRGLAYRAGGGAVLAGQAEDADLTASAWTATFAVSGNDLLLQVTGAAATTIDWTARLRWEVRT